MPSWYLRNSDRDFNHLTYSYRLCPSDGVRESADSGLLLCLAMTWAAAMANSVMAPVWWNNPCPDGDGDLPLFRDSILL